MSGGDDPGLAYERFLGKHHPAARRAAGVFYTPRPIVAFVVEQTLGRFLVNFSDNDATPERVARLRVLDPACGAGVFLVEAYRRILRWYVEHYREHAPEQLVLEEHGWTLGPPARAQIIKNNLRGVDIDPRAVALTCEALQAELGRDAPRLDWTKIIKRGNFLIGDDWRAARPDASAEEVMRVAPFDLRGEFADVFAEGGFAVVLGNPPFIKEYTERRVFDDLRGTECGRYYQGKMDYWYLFACRGLDVLRAGGLQGFIATGNWGTQTGASKLRAKLLGEAELRLFVDFGPVRVFGDAGVKTMVYVAERTGRRHAGATRVVRVTRDAEAAVERALALAAGDGVECFDAAVESTGGAFTFVAGDDARLLARIAAAGAWRLGAADIGQGIVAPQESVLIKHLARLPAGAREGDGIFVLSDAERVALGLGDEEELLRPFYTSRQVRPFRVTPEHEHWIIYIDSRRARDMTRYPRLRAHLDRYAILSTSAFGPYGLHRARDPGLFINGPKIVAMRKTAAPVFAYCELPCYVSQTFNVIKTDGVDLAGLTALLNSKVVHYWLRRRGKLQGAQLQVDAGPLMGIPLVRDLPGAIVALGRRLVAGEDAEARAALDREVYALYGLHDGDVARIEAVVRHTVRL